MYKAHPPPLDSHILVYNIDVPFSWVITVNTYRPKLVENRCKDLFSTFGVRESKSGGIVQCGAGN